MLTPEFIDTKDLEKIQTLKISADLLLQEEMNSSSMIDSFHHLEENYGDQPFYHLLLHGRLEGEGRFEDQANLSGQASAIKEASYLKHLYAQDLENADRSRESLDVYNQIIERAEEPTKTIQRAYIRAAQIYMKQGDLETCEEYLNKAYTIDSTSYDLNLSFGFMYLKQGELTLAREKFTMALDQSINGETASVWFGLALIYATVSEFEDACACLKQMITAGGSNLKSLELYFKWSDQLPDSNYLLDQLNIYLKANPSDTAALWLKVCWYDRRSNHKMALQLIEEMQTKIHPLPSSAIQMREELSGLV